MADKWTSDDVGDQSGRTIVVTGGNSGIGLEAAKVLGAKGADVVLACRSVGKAEAARDEIVGLSPEASVEILELDLADLASVRAAAETFTSGHDRLDVLINNAGIMAVPRGQTADGFEMQFGTNHLGHFAFTGLVLAPLLATTGSRMVAISSYGHRMGKMDFDDLGWDGRYHKWLAYGRTKLANLLFTYELQRRLDAAGQPTLSVAAHPGTSSTNLAHREPGSEGAWVSRLFTPISDRIVQSAEMGALPTLRAATDPAVSGGDYYGPGGFMQQGGHPVQVDSNRRSHDLDDARRLWKVSEELTGVTYDALAP